MKPAALIAVAILLASCATPPATGTGGIDPASAAWAADGTATRAWANSTGTAVSANSTIAAANYQATVNAQETAVQATVAAAPTVTAQAELQSVAAVATATMAGILQNREHDASTATAVHIQAQIGYDAHQAQKRGDVAAFWHFARIVFLVLFAIGSYTGLRHLIPGLYAWLVPSQDVVLDGDGKLVAVGRGYAAVQPPPPPVEIQATQEPPTPEQFYETEVHHGDAHFTVLSPTPGDYINWLSGVIDNPRMEFSNNQRMVRGWPANEYWKMIADMKRVGWLHGKPDSRGCYTMTDIGKQQARAWLAER